MFFFHFSHAIRPSRGSVSSGAATGRSASEPSLIYSRYVVCVVAQYFRSGKISIHPLSGSWAGFARPHEKRKDCAAGTGDSTRVQQQLTIRPAGFWRPRNMQHLLLIQKLFFSLPGCVASDHAGPSRVEGRVRVNWCIRRNMNIRHPSLSRRLRDNPQDGHGSSGRSHRQGVTGIAPFVAGLPESDSS